VRERGEVLECGGDDLGALGNWGGWLYECLVASRWTCIMNDGWINGLCTRRDSRWRF